MKTILLSLLAVAIYTKPANGQSQSISQALVCADDLSCVTFNDTPRPLFNTDGSSPIITAPSGGIRFLLGANAGSSFGNLYAGIDAKIEYPVNRRIELDARDLFSPVEQHYPYGDGWANTVQGGGILWLTHSIGANANVERSQYRVAISKHAEYFSSGLTVRHSYSSIPLRFTFDYLGEFHNGIDATGTESAHLKAGEFNIDMRAGCSGPVCYRVAIDFKVGHVLTQSNPLCDGTYSGLVTCPRTGASSGAFTGSVSVEFPRRRATEQLAF